MANQVSLAVTNSKNRNGSDGQSLKNEILLDLPGNEFDLVFGSLEFVELPLRAVLHEMHTPLEHVYFLNAGLASVLKVMNDGKSVEVGVIGKEGVTGLPLMVGLKTNPTQVVMQVAGSAFRISERNLVQALSECLHLERALNRYAYDLGLQATQLAACNRLHEVEERLARWLLMSQDRVGDSCITTTQEFLADMLGTRRASVTVAAGILQKAGLITYIRGEINIVNRSRLREASCECYESLVRQAHVWKQEAKPTA